MADALMDGYFFRKTLKLTLLRVLSSKHMWIWLVCERDGEKEGEAETGASEGFMGVIMESQWLGH